MNHYSQKAEQDYILRVLGHRTTGKFLDIGAYDGVNYSNTMALVDLGWSGVMVEPGLEAFQALLNNHGTNEKLTLVHAAVGPPGLSMFWNCATTFSTTLASNRDKFIHEGFSPPFYVATLDLLHLVSFGPFDMISIDTEGTSVDILKRVLQMGMHPKCICVEHDGVRRDEALAAATMAGYRLVMENEENMVVEAT